MRQFDFVVLGSGPAGRRAAVQVAKLGRSVLVIDDRERVGGVSVHCGTIPSKTLRETVLNLSGWRERSFYGRAYRAKRDIADADLRSRLGMTLAHEIDVLEHQFARNGIALARGSARFLDQNRLAIDGVDGTETICGDKFLIATGTRPHRPDTIPFDNHCIVDSDALIAAPRVPKSMIVIGAGVIGIEYATIFSALDVPVTLIEPRESFFDFLDSEIVQSFTCQLRDRGISIRLGCTADRIERTRGGQALATLSDGRAVQADMLLYAAGRIGATAGIGLDILGIETDRRGRISVEPATFQTSLPHIYAAGDVIGFPSLASTSMEQGRIAACHAFGAALASAPQHFPIGIYAVPEISCVGLTEEEARKQGVAYECGVARLRETSRGHIMGLEAGLLKMIFALETRRLLGVHVIGEGATELIHIGQAVINLGGTIDYFIENSFNYPTLAEAYKVAALDAWNRMPRAVPVIVKERRRRPRLELAKAA